MNFCRFIIVMIIFFIIVVMVIIVIIVGLVFGYISFVIVGELCIGIFGIFCYNV